MLWTALREFLIMHPIMPFVTAEIWQALFARRGRFRRGGAVPAQRVPASSPKPPPAWEARAVIGMIHDPRRAEHRSIPQADRADPSVGRPPEGRP